MELWLSFQLVIKMKNKSETCIESKMPITKSGDFHFFYLTGAVAERGEGRAPDHLRAANRLHVGAVQRVLRPREPHCGRRRRRRRRGRRGAHEHRHVLLLRGQSLDIPRNKSEEVTDCSVLTTHAFTRKGS